MFNILTLNKISETGLGCLEKEKYSVFNECADPDGIILRSFAMHDMELPDSLLAVARAGAGVNNIPIDKCSEKGIVVFNTPGANANAVKELVIGMMLAASRNVVSGVNWAQGLKGQDGVPALVEKGKAAFVGPEISGKTLGVLGSSGAIGRLITNSCAALGMNIIGYDPFPLENPSFKQVNSYDEVFAECDYITIHIPYTTENKGLFNDAAFAKVKKGVYLFNFSRGEIVDSAAVVKAVSDGTVACYATDFPTEEMLGVKNILPVPHLGASTPESEENCAAMASAQLKNYLEYGNIKNSVNFPNCELAYTGKRRACVNYKSGSGFEVKIGEALMREGISANAVYMEKGGYGYAIIEADCDCDAACRELMKIGGVLRVRCI